MCVCVCVAGCEIVLQAVRCVCVAGCEIVLQAVRCVCVAGCEMCVCVCCRL